MEKKRHVFSIDKETMSLKATLFLFYGALYSIAPYFTVHMVEVGLSIEEIGIIYAVLPFASFAGPPVAGMIADRIGNYKTVLYISLFLNGLFVNMLLLVDAKGLPIKSESNTTYATLECSDNSTQVKWRSCEGSCGIAEELSMTILLDSCQFGCETATAEDSGGCSSEECLSNRTAMTFLVKNLYSDENCTAELSPKYDYFETLLCACSTKCDALLHGIVCNSTEVPQQKDPNHNHPYYDESVHIRGFWYYFVLRVLATIFIGVNFSMLDSTTLCKVKETGGQYGRQRVWATVGAAITSPMTGALIDLISGLRGFDDYSIAFYINNVLLALTMVSLLKVELIVDRPDSSFCKNVRKLLELPDVAIFVLMMFVLGTLWGFIESFLFIFLKDLGAPVYLMGLTVTASCLVGVPFMFCSEWIISRFGKINMIILAFFTYAVRLVGYSVINNPWLCFPFEVMEVVTQHLMAIASATFCASAAPVGLLATLNGLVGGAHYNIGRGAGSFLGGFFIGSYGLPTAFQLMGIVAAVGGVAYTLMQLAWLRRYDALRTKSAELRERENSAIGALHQHVKYSAVSSTKYDVE